VPSDSRYEWISGHFNLDLSFIIFGLFHLVLKCDFEYSKRKMICKMVYRHVFYFFVFKQDFGKISSFFKEKKNSCCNQLELIN
jgi:hypothetical protein